MNILFKASKTSRAQEALRLFKESYGQSECPDVVVALGGDGHLIRVLKEVGGHLPVYGLNRGTLGFLLNEFSESGLPERIENSEEISLNPLKLSFGHDNVFAVNEVALFRSSSKMMASKISVNGNAAIENLVSDGLLVSTPAGSTAYNYSCYGPILPIDSELIVLTGISPNYPKRWQSAILPSDSVVSVEAEGTFRIEIDGKTCYEIEKGEMNINVDKKVDYRLLLDKNTFGNRIMKEQFY